MTEASLTSAPAANLPAKPPTNSLLRHAIYVVADNPVTGLSFGLFILIALCALVGPYVVPYDPLASDTTATLQSPSWQHWFGTDLVGRDIFSRVVVATRLDFVIAIASVACGRPVTPQERKKPTWSNTQRDSTTSAYSATSPPVGPGCPSSSRPTIFTRIW